MEIIASDIENGNLPLQQNKVVDSWEQENLYRQIDEVNMVTEPGLFPYVVKKPFEVMTVPEKEIA